MNYLKQQLKLFLESFKFKKNFLYTIAYDALFFIIAILFIKLFGSILGRMSSNVDMSIINKAVLSPSPAQAEILKMTLTNAKAVVYGLGIAIVLYLIIIIFAWSFSRGLIYSKLLNKKFNNRFYWKFLSLNLVFYIPLLIISIAFVYVIKEIPQAIYILILVLLAIFYFLALSYISFVKNNKIFKAIGNALEFGFTKIHKMLIPLIFILIMFVIMSLLTALIIMNLSFSIKPYVSLFIFLIYLAWLRIYFVNSALKANI
jgi:hypothetical protein